ncbi:MAG: SGNH/GDSL hydrolase family protein [Proteobacteria bacterium]|nr:SGNH/GDSL hydrolase family protein [Pseudomonadota bacterium]
MSTLSKFSNNLSNGFQAATQPADAPQPSSDTTTIPSAALGTTLTPAFIGTDVVAPPPGGFSNIYAFGDSLSDTGNAWIGTARVVPNGDLYSNGRFSNGPVWVEDLAKDLGLPAPGPSVTGGTDYAYGGAQTGATSAHALNPTDLPGQLGQFVASTPNPSPNALYTVWAGSNDVLTIANSTQTPDQQAASIQQAVGNEAAFVQGLVDHGAKNIVVMGVPDLGTIPYERDRPANVAAASDLAEQYNSQLGGILQAIMQAHPVSIDLINTYGLLDNAITNPSAYGLTNVTDPVWSGNLTDKNSGTFAATGADQGGYLFYDHMHPTATGHALLADAVTYQLTGTA